MTSRTTDIPAILRDGRRLDAAAARAVQHAVDRLRQSGVPIASSHNGRITIEQPKHSNGQSSPGK